MKSIKSTIGRVVVASVIMATLNGCAVALIAGAGVAASSANDRRTVGSQLDDNAIELKVANNIGSIDALNDHTNISVTGYNGILLLTGQAPNEMLRDQAVKIAKEAEGVRNVFDQIRITSVSSWTTDSSDVWITSKVKTELLADDTVEGLQIKVKTENSEVFLMGLVSRQEGEKAVELARNISGVERVFKLFEYR